MPDEAGPTPLSPSGPDTWRKACPVPTGSAQQRLSSLPTAPKRDPENALDDPASLCPLGEFGPNRSREPPHHGFRSMLPSRSFVRS